MSKTRETLRDRISSSSDRKFWRSRIRSSGQVEAPTTSPPMRSMPLVPLDNPPPTASSSSSFSFGLPASLAAGPSRTSNSLAQPVAGPSRLFSLSKSTSTVSSPSAMETGLPSPTPTTKEMMPEPMVGPPRTRSPSMELSPKILGKSILSKIQASSFMNLVRGSKDTAAQSNCGQPGADWEVDISPRQWIQDLGPDGQYSVPSSLPGPPTVAATVYPRRRPKTGALRPATAVKPRMEVDSFFLDAAAVRPTLQAEESGPPRKVVGVRQNGSPSVAKIQGRRVISASLSDDSDMEEVVIPSLGTESVSASTAMMDETGDMSATATLPTPASRNGFMSMRNVRGQAKETKESEEEELKQLLKERKAKAQKASGKAHPQSATPIQPTLPPKVINHSVSSNATTIPCEVVEQPMVTPPLDSNIELAGPSSSRKIRALPARSSMRNNIANGPLQQTSSADHTQELEDLGDRTLDRELTRFISEEKHQSALFAEGYERDVQVAVELVNERLLAVASSEDTQTTTLAESTRVVDPAPVPPASTPIPIQTTAQAQASSLLGALGGYAYGSSALDSLLATQTPQAPVTPALVSTSENEATFSQVDVEVENAANEPGQTSEAECDAAYEQWVRENPEDFAASIAAYLKPLLDAPMTENVLFTPPMEYAQEPGTIDNPFVPSFDASFTAHASSLIPHPSHHISFFPPTSLQTLSPLTLTKPYPETQDSLMSEPLPLSSNVSNHNVFGSMSVPSESSLSHTSSCPPTKPHVVIDRKDDGDFNLDSHMLEAHSIDEDVERTPLMESAAWTDDEGLMDVQLGDSKIGGDCKMEDGDGFNWEFWESTGVSVPDLVVEDMDLSTLALAWGGQGEDSGEGLLSASVGEEWNAPWYTSAVDGHPLKDIVSKFAAMSIQDELDVCIPTSEVNSPPKAFKSATEASPPLEIATVVPPTPTSGQSSESSTPTEVGELSTPSRLIVPSLSSPLLRPSPSSTPGSSTSFSASPSPTSTLVSPPFAFSSKYKLILPDVPQIPDWSKYQNKSQPEVAALEEVINVVPIPVTAKGEVDVVLDVVTSRSPDTSAPPPPPPPPCSPQSPSIVSPPTPPFGQQDLKVDDLPKSKPKSKGRKPRKPKFRVVPDIEYRRKDVDVAIHGPTSKSLQPSTPSTKQAFTATRLFKGYNDKLPVYYSMPGSWRWELPEWEYECVLVESDSV